MQVGCHISVALTDQLILEIVYDNNLSLSYFSAVFRSKIFSQVCYINVSLFYETLQPKYGNQFGRFFFKIVDTHEASQGAFLTQPFDNLHQVCG
jgi:hypothetical protein